MVGGVRLRKGWALLCGARGPRKQRRARAGGPTEEVRTAVGSEVALGQAWARMDERTGKRIIGN